MAKPNYIPYCENLNDAIACAGVLYEVLIDNTIPNEEQEGVAAGLTLASFLADRTVGHPGPVDAEKLKSGKLKAEKPKEELSQEDRKTLTDLRDKLTRYTPPERFNAPRPVGDRQNQNSMNPAGSPGAAPSRGNFFVGVILPLLLEALNRFLTR